MQTTAYQMLQALRGLGLHIGQIDGILAVRPRELINNEIREAIKSRRDELLQIVEIEGAPPCPHDILERAAILEYDGGHTREEADALALAHFGFTSWNEVHIAHSQLGRREP